MKTRKIILLTYLLTLSVFAFCQEYDIQWGGIEKSNGSSVIDVLPISGDQFYAIRQSRRSLSVSRYDNFKLTETGRISTKLKGNVALFEGVKKIGNELVVFLSDRREGKDLFFLQKYNAELKPEGDGIVLASYDLEWGYNRGNFDIITSENNDFFAVIWNVPGKNENKDKYGFKVFDNQLNEISEGDYVLPFRGDLAEINEHYLSNTGNYFISVTEYSEPETKKLFKNYMNYRALHLFHITPDLTDQFTVDLKGKRVETMSMNSDNNKLFTLTGVYGEPMQSGGAGLFFLRFDFETSTMVDQGFEKFEKNFIISDWSQKEIEKSNRKEAKGKSEPQLFDYKMRQTEILEDGSIVGSMEQYFVISNTYYDNRGYSQYFYDYYYKDIIAFKIGINGGFDWLRKIEKEQVSTNDGGPLSSYCRFVDGSNIVFIFNDNSDNYGADGNFIHTGLGNVYPTFFSSKKNIVSIVKVDIETGTTERKSLNINTEIEPIVIPKLFQVDYTNKEVLLYGIDRRNERFGIFNLHNK